MGPRSRDRGYRSECGQPFETLDELQWVHGHVTVVILTTKHRGTKRGKLQWVHGHVTVVIDNILSRAFERAEELQWVHGHVTVVIRGVREAYVDPEQASMGPRSRDRGYRALGHSAGFKLRVALQWVH